ncbi:ScbA/BarX family gamma-butyrolactone biosynthesis protein [Streptacidiphilus cavernicola]|uniref:ScbA/BarX family gamma-butyrolactone biosynthesis protein n=1 Tax=Streptacidiphilus cavernicola TaxID=3342716 RepID=A0ABV6VSE5_9ACTN
MRAQEASFVQTVPRQLVHRASVSEVLVTGWEETGPDTFQVSAQWPRAHSFFSPVAGTWHDGMLVAETVRQSVMLIAHTGFGVALGEHFVMSMLAFSVEPDGMELDAVPAELTLTLACGDVRRGRRGLIGMRAAVTLYRHGVAFGRGSARFTMVGSAAYARLRAGAAGARAPLCLPAPVDPGSVGRHREDDVLIADGGRPDSWLLRVDPSHPVMFDHPVDHVPGMVLMEGMRQASHLVSGMSRAVLLGFGADFARYAELDRPCVVSARLRGVRADGCASVAVTVEQDGHTAATGRALLMPVGAAR